MSKEAFQPDIPLKQFSSPVQKALATTVNAAIHRLDRGDRRKS
jgi:hypothetical protein